MKSAHRVLLITNQKAIYVHFIPTAVWLLFKPIIFVLKASFSMTNNHTISSSYSVLFRFVLLNPVLQLTSLRQTKC